VTGNVLFGFEEVVQMAVPISLTYGLLRSQLARGHVASLVRELERTEPMGVEASIQRALHDRSLRVAFWVPERGAYVDAAGAPYALPSAGSRRAVTELEQKGEPIAALVYDPALRDDPELVESVCAAARLALGNARLHAELRAQLVKVRESRARIVAAGDAERLRIERDLHDGAQQRLVSVALDLRVAQRRLAEAGPEIAKVLGDAVENLQAAIEELRELARGVYPPILTEEGLAAALRSLGDRAPLPVSVDAGADRGLSPEIASAAYFVACEALTNAVKHASPSRVTISAAQENGSLVLAIEDDGLGGADARKGTGLRGLADRVESYGGRLRIETRPGDGTRIIAELPCAS
jgi:signal transduction histidine kinase